MRRVVHVIPDAGSEPPLHPALANLEGLFAKLQLQAEAKKGISGVATAEVSQQ